MTKEQGPEIIVVGLHPADFQRLWDTGTLAYSCRGCGLALPDGEEDEWCQSCYAREEARLKAWNRAAGRRA